MRWIKVLSLAAVAVVAAMALVSVASASAANEVVLCKKLIEKGKLCPAGELWKKGSILLALAKESVLHSTFADITCEDSTLEAKTLAEIGASLPIEITSLAFGQLPVPSLGAGCTTCTAGIHPVVPMTGSVEVKGTDEFFLKASGKATLLACPSGQSECTYEGTNLTSPIEHIGTHPLHEGTNLPLIKIRAELSKVAPSGGLCPSTSQWEADYVVYLVDEGTTKGLGWPALATSATAEVVLCKKLIEKGKLCPAGELWKTGSVLLALAKEPVIHSTFADVKCEDSTLEAKTLADIGASLPIEITGFVFGVLPTPTLGAGCTTCTGGFHPVVPVSGSVQVKGVDEFSLKDSWKSTLLTCPLGQSECTYEGTNLVSPIEHIGTHPLHEGTNLPLININVELRRVAPSGGLCPGTSKFETKYVIYLVDEGTTKGLGWPALDLK